MAYWQERTAKAQDAISRKTEKEIEKQLAKYYANSAKKVIEEFEATYNKLLSTVEAGKIPTPADLYKLDKYWAMQAQMRKELNKLGEKQIAKLTKLFELNFFEVYHSLNIEGAQAFNTIDKKAVTQMINQVWCADGKSWSARIWENTERLADTLNEGLIYTVASGKKTTELKNILQERFNVSYSRADALVRTELGHIQTQAAKERYKDYGIEEVEIWADEDERRCKICGELHQKRYPINAAVPIPAHTNCRCCIVPVVK